MMRIILLIAFSGYLSLNAQQKIVLTPAASDCDGAIEISDSIIGPVSAPMGSGNKEEFNSVRNSPYYFAKEHHSVWYRLKISTTCILSIDIIPESINDDYDFVLFKAENGEFCRNFKVNKTLPVRSVISRNDKTISSQTGLKTGASEKHIPSGPGPSYASALEVKKGEIYYLVLDNVYENGKGHSIRFHYSDCTEEQITESPIEKKGILPECYLSLSISDRKTDELLNAEIRLRSKDEKEDQVFTDVSSIMKALKPNTSYSLTVNVPNYFTYVSEFNSPPSGENSFQKIKLDKIEVGNTIVIDNIYFHGGTAQFVSNSFTALRNLLNILKENPGLKIEIQGHVNKPLYVPNDQGESPQRLQNLSNERAFAVYEYLLKRGIEKERMLWKGYSNSKMINPYARSDEEQQQNRRVEILILAK